jgi:hypothetical protein
MGIEDHRREYVERLVAYGNSLDSAKGADPKARRAFVESLIAFASGLAPDVIDDGANGAELGAAFDLVRKNSQRLMRVIAGANALRFRELDPQNRAAIDALSSAGDLLGLSDQGRSETAHTALLARFLDTSPASPFPELAGLCANKLEALLVESLPLIGIPYTELELAKAQSRAELGLVSGGRVDVALLGSRTVVYIEAKIDAAEGAGQLDEYGEALEASYPDHQRVLAFLTARSEQLSATQRPHVHITFRDILLAWLPVATSSLRGAVELRLYLKSIAVHLYAVAAAGPFSEWPLHTQRACLDLIEKAGGAGAN